MRILRGYYRGWNACGYAGDSSFEMVRKRKNVILDTHAKFSVRYHPLSTTSPNVIDSIQLLTGEIGIDSAAHAGAANRLQSTESAEALLDWSVRAGVELLHNDLRQLSGGKLLLSAIDIHILEQGRRTR